MTIEQLFDFANSLDLDPQWDNDPGWLSFTGMCGNIIFGVSYQLKNKFYLWTQTKEYSPHIDYEQSKTLKDEDIAVKLLQMAYD